MRGRRIFVVDDDLLFALWVADELKDRGADVVGPVAVMDRALEFAATANIDAAVLDIEIGQELVWPVADALSVRRIPFIFLSGHDGALPDRFASHMLMSKLVVPSCWIEALRQILHRPATGATVRPAA